MVNNNNNDLISNSGHKTVLTILYEETKVCHCQWSQVKRAICYVESILMYGWEA